MAGGRWCRSRLQPVLFRLVLVSVPVVACGLLLLGFLGLDRLTYSYQYCGSYGVLDEELGWRLAPNASSCLSLRNRITGRLWWESRIYTNRLGFRDSAAGAEVPTGAIVAIGDSWTFGYGVDFEQSFPAQLARQAGTPVVNQGVPAYGAGAVLLLLSRTVESLRPRAVVYFAHGLWDRSICDPESAEETLVPCFQSSSDPDGIRLVRPRPGAVAAAAREHRVPGGSLTAGYESRLEYVLFSRPREIFDNWRRSRSSSRLGREEKARLVEAIAGYELKAYAELSTRLDFGFLLVDPLGTYERQAARFHGQLGPRLGHLSRKRWEERVGTALDRLGPERALVPHDGHFSSEANAVIAREIHRALVENGLLPERDVKPASVSR